MAKAEIILIFAFLHLCVCQEYILEIDQGKISGSARYDRKGGIFYSFLSIPYAKPPVGELRFKEPQPADAWSGILSATVDLPSCAQPGSTDEDCLYLNVYTPQSSSDSYDTLIDVMVFIHGGSFETGSGDQTSYSPEFLIPENIVLVTINYRLGILGSFHLEDKTLGYPGNLQMKDQVMALKWVQANIAKFGGNPNSVTIFGQSAGGTSIHYHILSPLSAGLFHKAIVQSGTAISPWAIGLPNNGILLAEILSITTTNTSEMLTQLHGISTQEILTAQSALTSKYFDNKWGFVGCPIVEQEIEGHSPFLTEKPLSVIKQGNYNYVPILIGYTSIDGAFVNQYYPQDVYKFPGDLGIDIGTQEAVDLLKIINTFYQSFNYPIIQLHTDVSYGFPAYRAAREHRKTTNSSIYLYKFSADTKLNLIKIFSGLGGIEGAVHSDELTYLFYTFFHGFVSIEPESVEDLAIDRIVKLWTNFAKYGNPSPDYSTNFKWMPITDDTFNYAEIGSFETVNGIDPDSKSMEFWNEIYDKFSSN